MCMNSNFSFSLHLGFILFATHCMSQGLLTENSLDMALLGAAVSLPHSLGNKCPSLQLSVLLAGPFTRARLVCFSSYLLTMQDPNPLTLASGWLRVFPLQLSVCRCFRWPAVPVINPNFMPHSVPCPSL